MNLKLNKQKDETIEFNDNTIYDKTKNQLVSDLVQNMEDNSIDLEDIEINSASLELSNKKYKQIFIKKTILYIAIILSFLSVFIFGAYKTFFEHKFTGKEIAIISNYYNNKTNFPESGVQGYLNANMDILLKEKLNIDSKVNKISIGQPAITKINAKNDTLANVYFYINLTSNLGNTKINAVLPIHWDVKYQEYIAAGDIIFTPNKPANIETKQIKNQLLSFENSAKEDSIPTEASKIFINNFFTILYNKQDISPYYDAITKLESSDIKYNGMSEYTLYKKANLNGYNALCNIVLVMPNGISYTTQKYLTIEKSGKSWIIKAVL